MWTDTDTDTDTQRVEGGGRQTDTPARRQTVRQTDTGRGRQTYAQAGGREVDGALQLPPTTMAAADSRSSHSPALH